MTFSQYPFDHDEALSDLSAMPGYDGTYTIAYYGSWSGFEDSGWLAIFECDGQLYLCEGGYSPEVGELEDVLTYQPISEERALAEISEMVEACTYAERMHSGIPSAPKP